MAPISQPTCHFASIFAHASQLRGVVQTINKDFQLDAPVHSGKSKWGFKLASETPKLNISFNHIEYGGW